MPGPRPIRTQRSTRRIGRLAISWEVRSCSLGRGHRELRAFGRAFRPPLHDRFLPGVEAYALAPVGVGISEQAVFPTSEPVPRHGNWDRNVDANHTDLDAAAELA